MAVLNASFARGLRLRRLFRHGDGRLLFVPLDHSVTDGPLRRGDLNSLLGELSGTGVDAVVLHKGSLRHVNTEWFGDMSLIVHLSVSTRLAPEPDAKYLVAHVEEALRLGADAVSVHVNLGSSQEARQIADMAAVAGSANAGTCRCWRWCTCADRRSPTRGRRSFWRTPRRWPPTSAPTSSRRITRAPPSRWPT